MKLQENVGRGARRTLSKTRPRLRGLAMDLGLLRYRPIELARPAAWDAGYKAGDWKRLEDLDELARYSLIAGYIRFFGPASSVLDVGCGAGLLIRRLPAGDYERYVGVDVSSAAVAQAKRLEEPGRIQFEVGELPPPERGRFQFVVCNEVLYYLWQPEQILSQIADRMEADGYLLTSIWRHPGSAGLTRLISRRFALIDSVEVRPGTAHRGWLTTVSCWRLVRAGPSEAR